MKKILFAAMAAIILCSVFVGIKTAKSDVYNYMSMAPTTNTVDPPLGGGDLTFLYNLTVTTNVTDVSAWQCKLLWNPTVLRVSQTPEGEPIIVWGDWMTGNVSVSKTLSSGGEYIILGQNFGAQTLNLTGSGLLARINFTFVLPGATSVRVLDARVWNDALDETPCTGNDGYVESDRPHPAFWWWTSDDASVDTAVTRIYGNGTLGNVSSRNHGTGPLPQANIYDARRNVPYGTVVYFTANFSYDVTNMVWNATAGKYELVEGANIKTYRWEYGDGAVDVYTGGNLTYLANHTYSAYKQAGWLVNLTVWDNQNDYWSSTWRYQGPAFDDTVPMWRDVGIVDIWPSQPPYQNYEEYDDDWSAYWFFDSTDFNLPNTADPYWDYILPVGWGYPEGTTVRESGEGLYVLVTANNYGSVPEKCLVNLYAIGVALKNSGTGPAYNALQQFTVEKIGTWTTTLQAKAGSGWGLLTTWAPPKNATYVLMATIDTANATTITDMNRADNTYVLPTPVSNINTWNFTSLSMVPHGPMNAKYICDIGKGGDGAIKADDLNLLLSQFGSKGPAGSTKIPISKP